MVSVKGPIYIACFLLQLEWSMNMTLGFQFKKNIILMERVCNDNFIFMKFKLMKIFEINKCVDTACSNTSISLSLRYYII